MNNEIKANWTAALRSGEFAQGRFYLSAKDPDIEGRQYCCLGVLCELAVREGIVGKRETSHHGVMKYGENSDVYLPQEVAEWAGLDSGDPIVRYQVTPDSDLADAHLSDLNDCGRLFPEIADLIDASL